MLHGTACASSKRTLPGTKIRHVFHLTPGEDNVRKVSYLDLYHRDSLRVSVTSLLQAPVFCVEHQNGVLPPATTLSTRTLCCSLNKNASLTSNQVRGRNQGSAAGSGGAREAGLQRGGQRHTADAIIAEKGKGLQYPRVAVPSTHQPAVFLAVAAAIALSLQEGAARRNGFEMQQPEV